MGCVGIFRRWRRFEGILFQGNILRFQQLEAVFDQFSSRRMLQPLDDDAANRGEVRGACSRSMAYDSGFQDVDHRASCCRPWSFMV